MKTAASDADGVADILKNRYGFQDITLLKNREATKSAIVRILRDYIKTMEADEQSADLLCGSW